MSGHTPGPWYEDLDEIDIKYGQRPLWIKDANGNPVCEYAGCGSHQAHWPNLADFRLVLAAPDLLDLAHKFARECAECGGAGSIETHHTRILTVSFNRCTACADIRAVIAKATGGPA